MHPSKKKKKKKKKEMIKFILNNYRLLTTGTDRLNPDAHPRRGLIYSCVDTNISLLFCLSFILNT